MTVPKIAAVVCARSGFTLRTPTHRTIAPITPMESNLLQIFALENISPLHLRQVLRDLNQNSSRLACRNPTSMNRIVTREGTRARARDYRSTKRDRQPVVAGFSPR